MKFQLEETWLTHLTRYSQCLWFRRWMSEFGFWRHPKFQICIAPENSPSCSCHFTSCKLTTLVHSSVKAPFLIKITQAIDNCPVIAHCLWKRFETYYKYFYALRKIRRLSRLYSTSSLWCIIIRALLTCHNNNDFNECTNTDFMIRLYEKMQFEANGHPYDWVS